MAGFGPATKQAHTQEAARHAGRNFLTCTSGVVGGQEHRACSIRARASTSPATCGVSAIGGGREPPSPSLVPVYKIDTLVMTGTGLFVCVMFANNANLN